MIPIIFVAIQLITRQLITATSFYDTSDTYATRTRRVPQYLFHRLLRYGGLNEKKMKKKINKIRFFRERQNHAMADKENLTTTWSSRNPTLPTQLPRQRTTSTTSGPAAATQAARRQSKKDKEARLNTAIEVLVQTCEETIEQLSKDFDLDATKVRSMVTHATTLKKPRKPNLHNAKLFHKRKELENGGLTTFYNDYVPITDATLLDGASPKRLSELQRLVDDDESLKTENLSRAQRKDLCTALMEERALKSTGTRATMRAATLDASLNASHITNEMHNMFLRTGVRSMIFFARSHTDDRFISTFYSVDEVTERFFPDILKLDAGNVTRKFELYTCAEEKTAMKTESLESMRVDISRLIIDGLREFEVTFDAYLA
ncbi:hypothetical protein H0H93_012842 [Arthromyces matolae]|nr:hypothetical protein H0H93_012842 [Arthromyces matolae]